MAKVWDGFIRGNWKEPVAIWTDSNYAKANWTYNVSLEEGLEPSINLAIDAKNVSQTWINLADVYYNSTDALNEPWMEGLSEQVWDRFLHGKWMTNGSISDTGS